MELRFKPLTKGLGFQNVPEQPAAPEPQPRPLAPRGARAAGAPTFATKLHRPAAAAVSTPLATDKRLPPLEATRESTKSMSYLWRRFGAFVSDTLVNVAVLTLLTVIGIMQIGQRAWDFMTWELGLVVGLAFFVASWLIVTVEDVAFRTSIGKRIFDLHLPGSRVAIFLRSFFFPISLAPLGLGLLWALWDPQKRTWHDMIFEVQPERL